MPGDLVVVVHGRPAPQGSKRHVGHGVMVESSKSLKAWRDTVTLQTADTIRDTGWQPATGPVTLALTFTLPKPQRPKNQAHITRPDLDKLTRAVLDALTDAGAWNDDAQVCDLHASKTYPGGDIDALDTPGVSITLRSYQ